MLALVVAAVVAQAAPEPAAPEPATPAEQPKKKVVLGVTPIGWPPDLVRFTTWEASLEGGPGLVWFAADPPATLVGGMLRARAGVLRVNNDWHWMAGVIGELQLVSSGARTFTVGVQGEVMNQERGFWAQAGLTLDVAPAVRPGVMLSVGWSLLGVEGQARGGFGTTFDVAGFVKLRIPVRHILLALGVRPANEAAAHP